MTISEPRASLSLPFRRKWTVVPSVIDRIMKPSWLAALPALLCFPLEMGSVMFPSLVSQLKPIIPNPTRASRIHTSIWVVFGVWLS